MQKQSSMAFQSCKGGFCAFLHPVGASWKRHPSGGTVIPGSESPFRISPKSDRAQRTNQNGGSSAFALLRARSIEQRGPEDFQRAFENVNACSALTCISLEPRMRIEGVRIADR
jgi:hypothetical protein